MGRTAGIYCGRKGKNVFLGNMQESRKLLRLFLAKRGNDMKKEFLDLKEILREPDLYYAHSKSDGEGEIQYETLEEHTTLCQYYFEKICHCKKIEEKMEFFYQKFMGKTSEQTKKLFDEMWKNVVTFHDVGKVNPLFQSNVLHREDIVKNPSYNLTGSKHSVLSAVIYMDYYLDKAEQLDHYEEARGLLILIMCHGYLISRHHSGLVSMEAFLVGEQKDELDKAIKVLEKEYRKIGKKQFLFDQECIKVMGQEFKDINCTKQQSIWLYLYEKLLYSLLIAADYYATSEYISGIKTKDIGEIENISEFYESFQNTEINQSIREYEKTTYPMKNQKLQEIRDINVLRKEIFLEAEKNLLDSKDCSIFYIEAPTGSGKSNLSMNLSFRLAQLDEDLKKIYYIYPFNTLIEQNQEIMERTFGNNQEIMEKIAVINSITPIKQVTKEREREEELENGTYYERALLNRQFLNYPIILTTHVSLFDTIFGDSKESAFGFHQLVGGILVLDEIQSYKHEIWGEIITFLTELSEFLHMKIIIMSATLPNLEKLKKESMQASYLIKSRDRYFKHACFKDRVSVSRELLQQEMSMDLLLEHVKGQCGNGNKILIEFIRKGSAEEFYQMLLKEEIQETVLCMTGDDSILERKQMIKKIKNEKGIILVSTQVIEAGVDIDMDIGYKAIAKMDSEEQFMGRINRSYTKGRTGIVYFFQMDNPQKIYTGDSRANQEFRITNETIWEWMKNKNFPEYYKGILDLWKKNHERDSEINVYSDLVKKLDFPKIKKKMQLIDESRWNVSVYLARVVVNEQGEKIDGKKVWESYKKLLYDTEISYAPKKVKLSEITAKMNYFMYQVQQVDCTYDEQIGEIFYIEEGEKYIKNGKINRAMIVGQISEFI